MRNITLLSLIILLSARLPSKANNVISTYQGQIDTIDNTINGKIDVIDIEQKRIEEKHRRFISAKASFGYCLDSKTRNWFSNGAYPAFDIYLGLDTKGMQNNLFAKLYNYPRYGIGIGYEDFSKVKITDATSYFKDILSIYAFFDRDIIRTKKFSLSYIVEAGLSWSSGLYDPINNPSNIFLSTPVFFNIAGGIGLTGHITENFSLGTHIMLSHHSNGRLSLPNQGVNMFGISLDARYTFDHPRHSTIKTPDNQLYKNQLLENQKLDNQLTENHLNDNKARKVKGSRIEMLDKDERKKIQNELKDKNGWDFNIYLGGGVQGTKADWKAYQKDERDPEEKWTGFKMYPRISLSTDFAYRYSPRFSTGLSVGMYYYSGLSQLKASEIKAYGDEAVAAGPGYNNFVLGIGVLQQIYFKNVAIYIELGVYPYKKLGISHAIGWNYQKAGIRLYMPALQNMFIGFGLKAIDFAESEYMEFSLGFDIHYNKNKKRLD